MTVSCILSLSLLLGVQAAVAPSQKEIDAGGKRGRVYLKTAPSPGDCLEAHNCDELVLLTLILPKPFTFTISLAPSLMPEDSEKWEFRMKSGIRLRAITYQLAGDRYFLRTASGTLSVQKAEVESIVKIESEK